MKIKFILLIICFVMLNLQAGENKRYGKHVQIESIEIELQALVDAVTICKYHSFYLDKPHERYLKCISDGNKKQQAIISYFKNLNDKKPKTAMEILIEIFKKTIKGKETQNHSQKIVK